VEDVTHLATFRSVAICWSRSQIGSIGNFEIEDVGVLDPGGSLVSRTASATATWLMGPASVLVNDTNLIDVVEEAFEIRSCIKVDGNHVTSGVCRERGSVNLHAVHIADDVDLQIRLAPVELSELVEVEWDGSPLLVTFLFHPLSLKEGSKVVSESTVY
jgi:hypothetical protein